MSEALLSCSHPLPSIHSTRGLVGIGHVSVGSKTSRRDSRGGRFVSTLPLITLNIPKSSIFHEGLFAALFPILFSLPTPLCAFQDVCVGDSVRKSWESNWEFWPKIPGKLTEYSGGNCISYWQVPQTSEQVEVNKVWVLG